MSSLILHHESSLRHDTGAHPERAERIVAIERELAARDWLGYDVQQSPAATAALLHAIHPPQYVESIEEACAAGGALDADTIVSQGSYEAALHAAGGAAALVDALATGAADVGASLHRPPGHHAETARAMGFCLFNNVAVAARRAIDEHGLERVLVLDWDVHHGNGTNDLFREDPRVLFISIHEFPMWPGTGAAWDVGSGAGTDYTVNLPVPSQSGDAVYTALVDHVVVPATLRFAPQLVLISAGFDAHADDPLASCTVSEAGFATMAASMRRVSAEVGAPLGIVLEGGYDLDALARSTAATLETVRRDPAALAAEPVAGHPLAAEAVRRFPRWAG